MPPGGPRTESEPESMWLATTPETDYAPLAGGLDVDTVVVGGGITGLTAADRLTAAGQTVAVLEADRIAESTTGHTTAKLTSQHGLLYDYLTSTFDDERARQYAEANEAAIDTVESRIEALGVDCGFERLPAYVYAASADDVDSLRAEAAAAADLGLPASFTESTDLPYDVPGAVRFDHQAQFHPRTYLLSVAESVHGDGSHVFEETRALDVDPGDPCEVETRRGTVTADDVVVATHFPLDDRNGYFARMHPKQAYLLAVRVGGDLPGGMYYSTASPADTFRPCTVDGEEFLIVGGQSHDVGVTDPPTAERYRRCEAFAREHFDVESVAYRWSTHDYFTVDRVPYVGRAGPGRDHVYVGTGFNGWGMSGGVAAGEIIAELVLTGDSDRADVFDPLRLEPGASAWRFLRENAKVAGRFVGDWVAALSSAGDLPASGEATVTRRNGRPCGVYRDEDGDVHAVSAVCPHMDCLVRWNDAERTWDCPCHGSRFDHDGEVISGPAVEDLPTTEL
ncbi:(2Fe-2S)-binding protein [Halobacteriales archaeon QS_1_69_70]|nr:MAG: (2Fe-2S)-binding protein [Halobacteriales archaeon QS_1_69_70]